MNKLLILLLALGAGSLGLASCDLAGGRTGLALQAELGYVNGNRNSFLVPGMGYQEIVAETNLPADSASPRSYTAISLTARDLPLRAMTITLVPAQTLGNGQKLTASAIVRITDLSTAVNASYTPKNAVYHLDAACGFGEENYSVPNGPGYLTLSWNTNKLTPLGSDKSVTDFILQQDKIIHVSLVARKY